MKYDIESIKKRKQKEKKLRKIIDIIMIILIYNVVLVVISCMNKISPTNIFGYKAFVITTSSMEPTISEGDIVIVKEIKKDKIKQGIIITFYKEGQYITHRVIDIVQENNITQYITKGDNNNIEDSEKTEFQDVEGEMIASIPHLGTLIRFLENRIVFLVFILGILVLTFFKVLFIEKKENRREKKEIEERKNSENRIN